MYNTIIIFTQLSQDAERILKQAERVLRYNWNLYGFQRLGSGYEVITTDGFGNPYGDERELKLFGIAIKVPEHMDYRTARGEGVPIGSGPMESQCSQNQNRFKRRGQFWSKEGFASFLEAYVWYTNNEIKYLYRTAA